MHEPYETFLKLLASGNEAETLNFLEQHLKELPEDLQEKIVFTLFEDATMKELAQQQALSEVQTEGLDILGKLQNAKKMYEEAEQMESLKNTLSA